MFLAHLIFADIDGSSSYSFAKRVDVIHKFQEICWSKKPEELNSHSFFSVDNDSLMIGFGAQEGFDSNESILDFVSNLSKELSREKISVSFGVYLSGAENINEHYSDLIKYRKDMIYMPDQGYQAEGKVLRRTLVGDPLIVAARLLSISKASKKKICVAVGKDASWGELELLSEEQYIKFPCWRKYLCPDHMTFMDDYGIRDVYYLNEVSIEAQL